MADMPFENEPRRAVPDPADLSAASLPASLVDVEEMLLVADFSNYRDSIGATHRADRDAPVYRELLHAIIEVQRLFDGVVPQYLERPREKIAMMCASGGSTFNGQQAVALMEVALMEGITSTINKFGLPTRPLGLSTASPDPVTSPVVMPSVEVLSEPAGVVVAVDRGVWPRFSLSLILTKGAFEEALSSFSVISSFLDERVKDDPQAWSHCLPAASSIFALLFDEVRSHESPILGIKRVAGPSSQCVFQMSVVSLVEQLSFSSLILPADAVRETTHHIALRHNEFGIVEPHWLGKKEAA
jgi:hypothetical protein